MQEPGDDSCDGERHQNAAVDAGSPPSSGDSGHAMSVDERNAAIRAELEALTKATFEREPGLESQTLAKLSGEASTLQKEGRYLEAVAAYNKVFAKSRLQNLTHKDMFVCYGNRASAFLRLGLHQEALQDAEKSRAMAESVLGASARASSAYVRCFDLKGKALTGLGRYREAMQCFDQGLKFDPFNARMKAGQDEAVRLHVKDLAEVITFEPLTGMVTFNPGKGMETLALPHAEVLDRRITYHAHSAPLHKVRDDNMMPKQLLSTFHADNDYHIKDTYNYVTVRTDVMKPMQHIEYLEDTYRQDAMRAAVSAAVTAITDKDLDCRVLYLGAGARHVTATERWLYLASVCKEVLVANGCRDDQAKVVYKRPSDLALLEDVPIVCNLLIAELLDDGLLSSGLIPGITHALDNYLLTHDAVVIPASATVYMQAVELLTPPVCGLNMSAANSARWFPSHASGVPYDPSICKPLSDPVEVWHFDMLNLPNSTESKSLDVCFTSRGTFNTVMFWYDLHLAEGIHLCTGPNEVAKGLTTLRPALQHLHGEISVDTGMVLPVMASHNTICMSFAVEAAEYLRLHKPSPAVPVNHFSMLGDSRRNQAYDSAICRAVQRAKDTRGHAHVLDMGAGTGILSLMAARAGADSVVAAELLPDLCDIARRAVALNGMSEKITVVNRDVAKLQRGKDISRQGVNVVVADIFDSGLLGFSFEWILDAAMRSVIQPGAIVVPAAATVYCVGVEAMSSKVDGYDFSPVNKYRWDKIYSTVDMSRIGHKVLTKPKKVSEFHFDGNRQGVQIRESLLKLEAIAEGTLNAVVFWFDLHLDSTETISNAPPGFLPGGLSGADTLLSDAARQLSTLHNQTSDNGHGPTTTTAHQQHKDCPIAEDAEAAQGSCDGKSQSYWGQSLQYFDRMLHVKPGGKRIAILVQQDGPRISFNLRGGLGEPVEKSPWKVEWGGGASIENPHVQRVQYCDLLVKDFLQRVRGKRFPPIEKDMKMVLAHCGSLFLDPGCTSEVYCHMVLLERIHQEVAEFSPGVSMEALMQQPLQRN